MNLTPEQLAREIIDGKLAACGLRRSSFSGHKTLAAPYIFDFQMFLKLQRTQITQT